MRSCRSLRQHVHAAQGILMQRSDEVDKLDRNGPRVRILFCHMSGHRRMSGCRFIATLDTQRHSGSFSAPILSHPRPRVEKFWLMLETYKALGSSCGGVRYGAVVCPIFSV